MNLRRCAVCWQHVAATTTYTIERHLDSLGHGTCPGTGAAYQITLPGAVERLVHA